MKRIRSFSICALVFSLLLVAVGNFIAFHSDFESSVTAKITQSLHSSASHEHADEHGNTDPCEQGYCHLGHCAKLVFSLVLVPKVQLSAESGYFVKPQSIQDLVLDGPYQPPKLS